MASQSDILTLPPAGTTDIFMCRIEATTRANRREAERQAVDRLLRHVFGDGVQLSHDEAGAPSVDTCPGHISISHTPRLAFLAVDPICPIGIDAELWRNSMPELAPRFMSQRELAVYGATPELMLRAWTTKEAAFKALGIPQLVVSGIILPDDTEAAVMTAAGRTLSLHFIPPADGHTVTLARLLPDAPEGKGE